LNRRAAKKTCASVNRLSRQELQDSEAADQARIFQTTKKADGACALIGLESDDLSSMT
jgi:hypothetical protein